jgi:hypothetical protein
VAAESTKLPLTIFFDGRRLNEKQKSNVLLEIPFGQSSGMISTKTGHSDLLEAAPPHAQLPN